MTRHLTKLCSVIGIGVMLAITITIGAAPILPGRDKIPDELRCLANITSVSTVIDEVVGIKIPNEKLLRKFHRTLKNEGFEINDDQETPRLALQYIAARDPDIPGALGVTIIIAVHQRVDLHRMEETMALPVASIVLATLGKEDQLEELVDHEIERAVQRLKIYVTRASAR